MPQFRFTVRGMMLAVALVALVIGFLATYHDRLGCGHASVPLTFQVVDSRDGQPVVGAQVELFNISGDPPTVTVTGSGGFASGICEADSSSYRGPFLQKYRIFHYSDSLRVGADGYQLVEGMLKDFMTDPAFRTNRKAHPPILIRIKRESGSAGV